MADAQININCLAKYGAAVFIIGDYSKQTRRIRTHKSKKSRKNKKQMNL